MPKFEEQLKQLEAIVDKLEHGDLPLEDSLQLFEQGMAASQACRQELDAAEGKVQELVKLANGEREVKDLELES